MELQVAEERMPKTKMIELKIDSNQDSRPRKMSCETKINLALALLWMKRTRKNSVGNINTTIELLNDPISAVTSSICVWKLATSYDEVISIPKWGTPTATPQVKITNIVRNKLRFTSLYSVFSLNSPQLGRRRKKKTKVQDTLFY